MCEASRSTDVQRSIINICSYSHAAGGIAGIAGWLANYTGQEYTHTHDHHDHNDRHPLTHPSSQDTGSTLRCYHRSDMATYMPRIATIIAGARSISLVGINLS